MDESSGNDITANQSDALIDLAVESWRFSRVFGRVVSKLNVTESSRYLNQARYFLKKIDDTLNPYGLRLVNLEGQLYDIGMAVTALNIGEFGPEDQLSIEQMVEPVVMGHDGLVRGGTVILAKVEHA